MIVCVGVYFGDWLVLVYCVVFVDEQFVVVFVGCDEFVVVFQDYEWVICFDVGVGVYYVFVCCGLY